MLRSIVKYATIARIAFKRNMQDLEQELTAEEILWEYLKSDDSIKKEIARKIWVILYINTRWKRNIDDLWDSIDTDHIDKNGNYNKSQDFLRTHICFDTLSFLNGDISFSDLQNSVPHTIPHTFKELKNDAWEKIDVDTALQKFWFPILWISTNNTIRHAFILLWERDGKIIGFDKNWSGQHRFFYYDPLYFADDWDHFHMFKKIKK